jgi:hypothetical protein
MALDWSTLKQGQLALAKQYADAGMMARAKAAFERAGGTWTNEVHRQLKAEAAATTRYGGDISFKWADYGVRTQAQLNQIIEWAKNGNFGRISKLINNLGGSKKWNKNLHTKLAAEYLGKQEKDTDPDKPGWQGTPTTEYKRDEPTVAPTLYDTTTTEVIDDVETVVPDWRTQFKGKITTGQIGSWGEGGSQARADAKKWRTLHMDAAKNKWGYGTDDFNKQAYINQRNKIARRHRKMLGAGSKTLKTGEVLSY